MVDKEKLQRKREETKKEILEKLETCDRFAVVRPFGFGKTYTILELCKTLKGKKIIIEPSLEILKNIKNNINEDTDCITYNTLLHKDFNSEKLLQYDYIFLDEIHRTLAPKWGKVLRDVLEKFEGKVVGFTATPIRGDGRRPVDEIFKGEQITELSLIEAIVEGFLPNPTYVTGIYELNQIILKNKQLRVQLKNYNLQNSLNKMFNKYLDFTKPLKIMAFSYTIDDIQQTKEYIEKWFGVKVNHYYYHSYQAEKQNKIELENFKNVKTGINVIHSINQLNEGFHFDELDALIFFRKTNSDVVYLQQLGRGLSENLHNIVVFDLMNNFMRNTNGYCKIIKEYAKNKNIAIKDIKTISGETLKIYCEQKDLIELLQKHSDKFKRVKITEEQEKFIAENYPQKGIKEISEIVGISVGVLNKYLRRKNIYVKKLHILTKEEQQYILENYKTKSLYAISRELGRSSSTTVINFVKQNNLEHKKTTRRESLTEEEIQFILMNYDKMTQTEIRKKINRSLDSIRKVLKNYGVYEKSKGYQFTEQQEKFMKENHLKMTCSAIGKAIGTNDGVVERYLIKNNLTRYYDPKKRRKKC